MRGLKTASYCADRRTDKQTDGHCDSMTELVQWGRFSEKINHLFRFSVIKYF